MGTKCSVSINHFINQKKVQDTLFSEIEARLIDIENKMSIYKEDSEISQINKYGFIEPVKVSDDTFEVIKSGYYYSELSNGVFDITVGSIVKLWNVSGENPKVPTEDQIKEALNRVGYQNIILYDDKRVGLKKEGVVIDLGGIAKGYATDEIRKILLENGIKSAIINLGGNIFVIGEKDSGKKWKVGIQNPLGHYGEYVAIIEVSDETVVTSGSYERFFKSNGKVYHHIFDTKNGYPKETDLLSATIIAKNSTKADALSTTLFILGSDYGFDFIKQFDDIYAIFITKNKDIIATDGIQNRLTINDNSFNLVSR